MERALGAPLEWKAGAMRGEMLWFNGQKERGVITAEDGRRIDVHKSGFMPGHEPLGRCAGTPVSFTVRDGDEGLHAVEVELLDSVAPRRARMRHRARA